ncbi:hypothetical protein L873DRAFT_1816420 [Choiromyces venosus 120613-1]|uniref:Uncharacterized protein n=1 Tax=Choiromyces venosus 120613-1 TaxID=1336337 RepID=A0A3N4J7B7_9PEZI|nr:hypothetical protein L873DRAFT_1816420 [Choiromyces venosus 120613-1]
MINYSLGFLPSSSLFSFPPSSSYPISSSPFLHNFFFSFSSTFSIFSSTYYYCI